MSAPSVRLRASRRPTLVIGGVLLTGLGLLLTMLGYGAWSVTSVAMAPALEPGGRALVEHKTITPDRGDVLLFDPTRVWPNDPAVADFPDRANLRFALRVVGLPGDRVRCCTDAGEILVNGEPLKEPNVRTQGNEAFGTFDITVGDDRLFLLGDARDVALDSRAHLDDEAGTVPLDAVESRVIGTVWPPWRVSFLRLYDVASARFLLGAVLFVLGVSVLAKQAVARLRRPSGRGRGQGFAPP